MTPTTDLIVVGAGPWGSAVAWRAARDGADVTLLDDGRVPAARAAAGMLGPWSEATDGEPEHFRLQREALDRWPSFVRDLTEDSGGDIGFERSGTIYTGTRPDEIPLVRRRQSLIAELGRTDGWQTGTQLRDAEPALGPNVAGGLIIPDEAQVDPRRLLGALDRACEARGVVPRRESVQSLRRTSGGVVQGVTLTSGDSIDAPAVVLAAGWAANTLGSRVPVRPVKGQTIRLRALDAGARAVQRVVRTPTVYIVARADGEIVVGATSEERSDLHANAGAVHTLLDDALRALPGLRETAFLEVVVGLRPATRDGLPAVGRDPEDGLVWAVGGYRHGVLLTPWAAEMTLRAIATESRSAEAADLSPARFPSREPACA